MLSSLLAFCWFKQAVAWFRFRALLWEPLSRLARGWFGFLRWPSFGNTWYRWNCRVTSRESFPLQSLNSLLRDVTLWHGLGLLQMVGFKASVQRTGARWRAQLRKREA